jgi:hypothetical protein
MPEFLHELDDVKALLELIAEERGLRPAVVEKDYWIMHCLWGIQRAGLKFELKGGTSLSKGWGIVRRFSDDVDIRFEPPADLDLGSDKPARVQARVSFFDRLAETIRIPGVFVERNPAYDDPKARNGGISLRYESRFPSLPELKKEVLLEVGFDRTVPNEPRDFDSWALERARGAGREVIDNRARGVHCFNPEYSFVDKIQTICRRFRQHRDRRDPLRDKPRHFLRHYYDLYMLLGIERVRAFVGTAEYMAYKGQKLKTGDAGEFTRGEAFSLDDPGRFALFRDEFEFTSLTLSPPKPSFEDVLGRIRENAPGF